MALLSTISIRQRTRKYIDHLLPLSHSGPEYRLLFQMVNQIFQKLLSIFRINKNQTRLMALSLAIYKHKYLIRALNQDGLGVRQRLLH